MLVILHRQKSSKPIWVVSDCLAPIGVHKMKFIQLGNSLIESSLLESSSKCVSRRDNMEGTQAGPHANTIVLDIAINHRKRHNPLELDMAKGKYNPPLRKLIETISHKVEAPLVKRQKSSMSKNNHVCLQHVVKKTQAWSDKCTILIKKNKSDNMCTHKKCTII